MKTLLLDPIDTVEVILETADQRFLPGAKVARVAMSKGSEIVKLGVTIGIAAKDIAVGELVDHQVMQELEEPRIARNDPRLPQISGFPQLPEYFRYFDGYLNSDGSAGTRNYLCISTSVHCVSAVSEHAVKVIRRDLLPKYENVDGVVLLNHTYGCGVAINARDACIPKRTLSNLMLNPNFGGYALLIGLGCEKLRHEMMVPASPQHGQQVSFQFDSLYIQSVEEAGFAAIINAICEKAEAALERLNSRRRQRLPISKLVVGMQCGGSDAFSGISANPMLGVMSDLLISAGGSSMFSENTECMDAESYLVTRCVNYETGRKLQEEFKWYRQYLARGGADRTANTTPGNKAGGLSSISEKALGSIAKAGRADIVDVIPPGERLNLPGLNYLSGPASDFICGTLQLAAGANMHIFTTGRGTPYSIDGFPVLKVSTTTHLFTHWRDIIDFDAGRVLSGQDLNQCALEFFEMLVKTASGKPTAAEKLGLSNDLVLFNPGPIT